MANLQPPLRIYPYNSWYLQQRGIYNFNTTSAGPTYLHIRTSVFHDEDTMWMVEAVGYNYGTSSPVRCSWGFYVYGNTIYQSGVADIYGGLNANGIYSASNGHVCLRATAASFYYLGITLNVYACRLDTTHKNVSIVAISQNSTPGNYY
jgi:hypothetical protein